MKKQSLKLTILTLILGVLLTGCSSSQPVTKDTTPKQEVKTTQPAQPTQPTKQATPEPSTLKELHWHASENQPPALLLDEKTFYGEWNLSNQAGTPDHLIILNADKTFKWYISDAKGIKDENNIATGTWGIETQAQQAQLSSVAKTVLLPTIEFTIKEVTKQVGKDVKTSAYLAVTAVEAGGQLVVIGETAFSTELISEDMTQLK